MPQKETPNQAEHTPDTPSAQPASSLFADLLGTRELPRAMTMTDVSAMVVGFAVAAYVYRGTVLLVHREGTVGLMLVGTIAYVWLGTVMTGPLVLGIRRMQHGRRHRLSSGETIWCVLGLIWLAVGLAHGLREFDPVTMTNLSSNAAALAAGLAPLLLLFVWHLERSRTRPAGPYSWCHHLGIFCAAAWPAGWALAAFLLGG